MRTLTLNRLKGLVADPKAEGELYEEMQALRSRFTPTLAATAQTRLGREDAIARAMDALKAIQHLILDGKDVRDGDAGHGLGHWSRDCIHSLYLAHDPFLDPGLVLPGILGGTLHDIGTLFLDRYADKSRAFRHAEAAALLVRAAGLESGVITEPEADLVAWAIAAHTHYLRPSVVECVDGVTREVHPYPDTHDGQPIHAVWLPRWTDRLDCSGPCMVGRHYLTLAKDHEDFGAHGFYTAKFGEVMQPLLRSDEEIKAAGGKQTMLEHMRMFARSQSNESPYGKYDRGRMVHQRDTYKASLEYIIAQVARPTDVNLERITKAWTKFLRTIEPTLKPETAQTLESNFRQLDVGSQRAWACGFRTAMTEYLVWGDRISEFLQSIPDAYDEFPGLPGGLLGLTADDSLMEY
ncbi:hypothetical protein M0Q28_00920 [Patescibacteria group bacterium]|jgi:hypothetical protein|nr:hypothetical protein [Patescibacteria group bacterium]